MNPNNLEPANVNASLVIRLTVCYCHMSPRWQHHANAYKLFMGNRKLVKQKLMLFAKLYGIWFLKPRGF